MKATKKGTKKVTRRQQMINYMEKHGFQHFSNWSNAKVAEKFEECKAVQAKLREREKFNSRFDEEPKLHQVAEFKEAMLRSLRRSWANERAWVKRSAL